MHVIYSELAKLDIIILHCSSLFTILYSYLDCIYLYVVLFLVRLIKIFFIVYISPVKNAFVYLSILEFFLFKNKISFCIIKFFVKRLF